MATITLVQAAAHIADDIHLMTAMPMNVDLTGLTGGAVQFRCTNPLNGPGGIAGAKSVKITYNAPIRPEHQDVQVSSVQP